MSPLEAWLFRYQCSCTVQWTILAHGVETVAICPRTRNASSSFLLLPRQVRAVSFFKDGASTLISSFCLSAAYSCAGHQFGAYTAFMWKATCIKVTAALLFLLRKGSGTWEMCALLQSRHKRQVAHRWRRLPLATQSLEPGACCWPVLGRRP